MGDLYDADVLEWSEHQAALLRRHAGGEKLNEQPDWANIIEEIESVGREQLHSVEGLLLHSLVHDLKAEAWPLAQDASKWRADAKLFRAQASLRFAPSMRQRLDLARLYAKALQAMPDTVDGQPPLPVPQTCTVALDEVLSREP